MKLRHAKGQGIAIDLMFAMLVFMLLLGAILGLWQSNAVFLEKQSSLSQLQSEAVQGVDMLVRHQGEPDDWETKQDLSNVTTIGLAKRDRVLDMDKVNRLVELAGDPPGFWEADYNTARTKMLAGRDFYFKLTNVEGAVIAQTANGNPQNMWAVNVKRVVTVGGDVAVAELTLYFPK